MLLKDFNKTRNPFIFLFSMAQPIKNNQDSKKISERNKLIGKGSCLHLLPMTCNGSIAEDITEEVQTAKCKRNLMIVRIPPVSTISPPSDIKPEE